MISEKVYNEMKQLIKEYEDNLINPIEVDMTQVPYIIDYEIVKHRHYNKAYGDDKECECGHAYYRHFDSYENMEPIGCKYCSCFHFVEKYPKKKIYGMIHLAGPDTLQKAIDEIKILEEEGLYGIIVENYHGSIEDVVDVLNYLKDNPTKLVVGINILPNEYDTAFDLCVKYPFIKAIQLDYVSGEYVNTPKVNSQEILSKMFNKGLYDMQILGGIWPKYYTPIEGSNLRGDILSSLDLITGLVVTGEGTGKETPIYKINSFKEILDSDYYGQNKDLIVGAGLNVDNVEEQLKIADGGIVGSAFKPRGRTNQMIDRDLVRAFMEKVNKLTND